MSCFKNLNFFVPMDASNVKPVPIPFSVHMMKFIMCWPLKIGANKLFKAIYYFFYCYLTFQMIFAVCGEYYYIITNWGDIPKVVDCICSCVTGQQAYLRYIVFFLQRNKLRNVLEKFGKHIYISPNEHPAISKICLSEMKLVQAFSIFFMATATFYAIVPFLSNEYSKGSTLPFKQEYPFDIWYTPMYQIIYWISVIVAYDAVVAMFSCDSTFAFLVTYTCGQFRILRENIENLKDMDSNRDIVTTAEKLEKLRKCIDHHNQLIDFVDQLEDLFSPMIWINFVHSSLLLCVIAFQLVVINLSLPEKEKYAIYLTSVLAQLFIICLEGEKLKELSWEIADAAFNCDWGRTDGSTSFTKNLQFVIFRAQVPKVITAMKFSELSLKSYTAILSSAMSYFTLLKALLEDMDV